MKGGTLTAVLYPEPPYLLSAVDPTLQMAVVTTKMTGVETPDAHTVVIRLSAPSPQLATVWSSYESPIIPKHVFEGTDLLANKAAAAPIGTGPFRFKEWVRGDHMILERTPDYWDAGKPYLDRIVFRFISDAGSRTAALESGEAQIGALTPVPLSDMARLTSGQDLVATTDGYDYMAPVLLLQLNTRKAPLLDRLVR